MLVGVLPLSNLNAKELARVNGRAVTESDLDLALPHLNEGQRKSFLSDNHSRREILTQVVNLEVLSQEAEKQKLDQDKNFKDQVSTYRKRLLADQLLSQQLEKELTPSAVKKYYKTHVDIFNSDLVRVQHILANSEEEAKKFLALAQDSKNDFQSLAEKYSRDPSAKNNRGDIGGITHFQMDPAFTQVAFTTPVGALAGPIHTIYGYHVIKVVDKKLGKPLEFSEVESQVRESLRQQLVGAYTSDLKSKARVQIGDEL